MLKKFKDMLGIEGVKIGLFIPEEIRIEDGEIDGIVYFNSQSDQAIKEIEIKLIENYKRGRKDGKLINDYLLGSLVITKDIFVEKDVEKKIRFQLKYVPMLSEMDKLERDNLFIRGFVKIAKRFNSVKSTYRVEATAKVAGTKLSPIVKQEIIVK